VEELLAARARETAIEERLETLEVSGALEHAWILSPSGGARRLDARRVGLELRRQAEARRYQPASGAPPQAALGASRRIFQGFDVLGNDDALEVGVHRVHGLPPDLFDLHYLYIELSSHESLELNSLDVKRVELENT
jgi:hypothetical protein